MCSVSYPVDFVFLPENSLDEKSFSEKRRAGQRNTWRWTCLHVWLGGEKGVFFISIYLNCVVLDSL